MKKLFYLFILFASCTDSNEKKLNRAINDRDTALAKKLAQEELNRIRSSITDSNFAAAIDASLQVQTTEFALQKADKSRQRIGVADSILVNHPNGKIFHDRIMKYYWVGLNKTTRSDDKKYFGAQIKMDREDWLRAKFSNKNTTEALISLHYIQKDLALISAIDALVDDDKMRQQLNKQYDDNAEIMRKN